MRMITKSQIAAIYTTLREKKLIDEKPNLISQFTAGRTTNCTQMTETEAREFLMKLNAPEDNSKMIRKLFAMAHEIGWIKSRMTLEGSVAATKPTTTEYNLQTRKDYTTLHSWINKYGYLKKPLNNYTYKELPKLVSQFEFGPYKDYLSK